MTKVSRRRSYSLVRLVIFAVLTSISQISISQTTTHAQQPRPYDQSLMKGLAWRSIGPYRGGRSAAVSGVASQPNVFYFGATGGGVWKTKDGGINWEAISDEYFK